MAMQGHSFVAFRSGAPFALVIGHKHGKPWACELIEVFVLEYQPTESFPCHSNESDSVSKTLQSNY